MSDLKKFIVGDRLATFPGGTINKLIDAELARRAAPAPAPTYEGAPGPTAVLVTETVAASSWDPDAEKLTPQEVNVRRLVRHADRDGSFTPLDDTLLAYSFYTTEIAVAEGKSRIGLVIAGVLLVVDCGEIDYTPSTSTEPGI